MPRRWDCQPRSPELPPATTLPSFCFRAVHWLGTDAGQPSFASSAMIAVRPDEGSIGSVLDWPSGKSTGYVAGDAGIRPAMAALSMP